MEKSFFEQMGGTYHQEGDYFLPDLFPPESISVGIWGQRRKWYLREHRVPFYTALLLGEKLDTYVMEVGEQAQEMFFRLIEQMAKQEGVTEQLKANNQMEWIKQMNGIRNRVEEIIYNELICN